MKSNGPKTIKRSRLSGFFLRLLGQTLSGVRLADGELHLLGSDRSMPSLEDMSAPARLTKFLWFDGISLSMKDGPNARVVGLDEHQAAQFVEVVNAEWSQVFAELFSNVEKELLALAEVVDRLAKPNRYPAACLVAPFHRRAKDVIAQLPHSFPNGVLSKAQLDTYNKVQGLQSNPAKARDTSIEAFVAAELNNHATFFDEIESNPLTKEQRLSVVADEDATLVLAGAGSGKTSVIVAKAAYLIRRGIRKETEILLIAFGAKAAEEMATRIEERTGASVDALTFHALGYRIINEVEGGAPALAAHASDDAQFSALLREILIDDLSKDPKLATVILKWFSELYWPYKSEWDFQTKDEYFQYVEAHELRTLQGELVKSFEEWEIANWLFLNGIAYTYEPDYEHDLPKNKYRAYTPDFRLEESGVYIEHFGVRKGRIENGIQELTTAPHVDRTAYLEGMEWKRQVHKEHGTTLIETFSYERVEGCLTQALAKKLAPFVEFDPPAPEKTFERLAEMGQVDAFTQVLATFLRHYKSSGTTISLCQQRAKASKDPARSLGFLMVFEPLLAAYQKRLGKRIDFEDMIVRATEHIQAGRYASPYHHILVDEFQDISDGRAQLLKALKAQHKDARIFAVGDDWQSIYRFAGSDIHIMRNFGQEFGGTFAGETGVHRTIDLGRTFRSVDKIALAAKRFVLKNPSQIEKRVVTIRSTNQPVIKISYYTRGKERASLGSVLSAIEPNKDTSKPTSVLLLGRYHFVKPDDLYKLARGFPHLEIKFMTIHGSKGLEADHVIILRATTDRLGFPSEIVDDPLLDMVLPEPEKYDHAEERRLFYVALTRARETVTISADRHRPSAFVRELIKDTAYEAIELGKSVVAEHRCEACGGRMLNLKSKEGALYYACEHMQLCGEMLPPCDVCGRDLPVANKRNSETLVCSCGASFPACPDCNDGRLVERKGPYGPFLGCVKFPGCKGRKNLVN